MFGFIILRHVNSIMTNLYWIESIRCIRKFYSNPILIIDDNSIKEFVTEATFENVTVVQSEFPKRGEILPYYYFYKLKPFDKAVILHDSVFIQKFIDFDSVKTVKFLWHFYHWWNSPDEELQKIIYLKNYEELLPTFLDQTKWLGCFGGMSCISHDFITTLVDKYDMFRLLELLTSRKERHNFERVFAVLCCTNEVNYHSINGYIFQNGVIEYSFNDYLLNKDNIHQKDMVKVWSGR